MALEDVDNVDAIGLDPRAGEAILTIADAWDWGDEREHLLALQAKLNVYFGFIESGAIYRAYRGATGQRLVIDVIGRFPVPPTAAAFFTRAAECAAQLDVVLRVNHWPGGENQAGRSELNARGAAPRGRSGRR